MKDRDDVVNEIIQQLSLEPHLEGGWALVGSSVAPGFIIRIMNWRTDTG